MDLTGPISWKQLSLGKQVTFNGAGIAIGAAYTTILQLDLQGIVENGPILLTYWVEIPTAVGSTNTYVRLRADPSNGAWTWDFEPAQGGVRHVAGDTVIYSGSAIIRRTDAGGGTTRRVALEGISAGANSTILANKAFLTGEVLSY